MAKRLGVCVYLNRRLKPDTWYLEGIERSEKSEPGSGRVVMQLICDEADNLNKKIILYPTNKKLREYYRQFGFERNATCEFIGGDRVHQYDIGTRHMIRYPMEAK